MNTSTTNKTILLISHYNNVESLYKSITSIGKNENLDILVVDDGSAKKPNYEQIKISYKGNGKVHYLPLEQNVGLAKALNNGLEYINNLNTHEYISRLDVGDIVNENRFSIQEKFLEENKDIYLIGSNITFVDEEGNFIYNLNLPETHQQILKKSHYNAPFIHPSIMFRRCITSTIGLYPENYSLTEDYAYFFKITKKHKTYNIQEYLVTCELNQKGLSYSKRRKQLNQRFKLLFENFDFSLHSFLGLVRTFILYITPKEGLLFLKKKLKIITL